MIAVRSRKLSRTRAFGLDARYWALIAFGVGTVVLLTVAADAALDAVSRDGSTRTGRIVGCGARGETVSPLKRRLAIAMDGGDTIVVTRFSSAGRACGDRVIVVERIRPWGSIWGPPSYAISHRKPVGADFHTR